MTSAPSRGEPSPYDTQKHAREAQTRTRPGALHPWPNGHPGPRRCHARVGRPAVVRSASRSRSSRRPSGDVSAIVAPRPFSPTGEALELSLSAVAARRPCGGRVSRRQRCSRGCQRQDDQADRDADSRRRQDPTRTGCTAEQPEVELVPRGEQCQISAVEGESEDRDRDHEGEDVTVAPICASRSGGVPPVRRGDARSWRDVVVEVEDVGGVVTALELLEPAVVGAVGDAGGLVGLVVAEVVEPAPA
jgi:hypothetical protein